MWVSGWAAPHNATKLAHSNGSHDHTFYAATTTTPNDQDWWRPTCGRAGSATQHQQIRTFVVCWGWHVRFRLLPRLHVWIVHMTLQPTQHWLQFKMLWNAGGSKEGEWVERYGSFTIIIGRGGRSLRVAVYSCCRRPFFVAAHFSVDMRWWVASVMFCIIVGTWEGRLLASCFMLLPGMVVYIESTSVGSPHCVDGESFRSGNGPF